MRQLLVANLLKRPTRTIVSMSAVAMAVILILVLTGLSHGLLSDAANRTQNIGADIIFQPSGASMFFAFSTNTLPAKITARLKDTPGITNVTPVLVYFSMKRFGITFGIDWESYDQFAGKLRILSGEKFSGENDAIVDDLFARNNNLKLGDTIHILNQDQGFKVVGICQSGMAAVRVFVPLNTLQTRMGSADKVSMVFIKCKDPQSIQQVYETLKRDYKGYTIIKTSELAHLMNENTPFLKEFTYTVIAISVFVSFLVILLAMYTSIFERTREIGILKAMGASKSFILHTIMKESLLLCLCGCVLGIVGTYVIIFIIRIQFPSMMIDIPFDWHFRACFLALLGGALGSLYPAFKAASQDPVVALSYE